MTRAHADALLMAWAEDLYLHGSQLARWTTDYVDIEESLAVGSMAQEDIAHAGAFLRLRAFDAEMRHAFFYERGTEQWAPSSLMDWDPPGAVPWPRTVVRGYLFSHAVDELAAKLSECGHSGVAETARVIRAEQRLHLSHWTRWVRILSRDSETSEEFREHVAAAGKRIHDLWGAPPEITERKVAALQFELDLDDLHARWGKRVQGTLASLGVEEFPVPACPTPRRSRGDSAFLRPTLERLQFLRRDNPEFHYEVYS